MVLHTHLTSCYTVRSQRDDDAEDVIDYVIRPQDTFDADILTTDAIKQCMMLCQLQSPTSDDFAKNEHATDEQCWKVPGYM